MSAVRVLVGTTKGLFVLAGGEDGWTVSGPHCDGWPINHAIGRDDSGEIWAAGGSEWQGAGVWHSPDGGDSWRLAKLSNGQADDWMAGNPEVAAQLGLTPSPPAPFTGQIDSIWSLGLVGGQVYAGAKPAALYRSGDGGDSWAKVQALTDHPSAKDWNPGAAGLTLHTIVCAPDAPERMWLGISAAGVFASEDGGASWDRRTRRSNEDAAGPGAGGHPAAGTADEIGFCVHNMVRAPGEGDVLYQQNHHGVYRSGDGGRSWHDITAGLPSTFGFPIAVHPRDPQRIWVLPLNGDSQGRYPPGGSAAVWTSGDGGRTWEARQQGLPRENCYFTVLRQAMATDAASPAGVYFGTNTGSVFASRDEGETWDEIARHLPTVLSVETVAG